MPENKKPTSISFPKNLISNMEKSMNSSYLPLKSDIFRKREKMKNITIALPEISVDNIQKLVDEGYLPSRSEAVRTAIREFLVKEQKVMKILGIIPK